MTPCKFTFDDTPAFDGFALGSKWNGFDNVSVTPDTLEEIMVWYAAEYADNCDDMRAIPVGEDGLVCLGWGFCTQIVHPTALDA